MREILQSFINRSQLKTMSSGEALTELKIGLQVLFMRPNIDSINDSLIPILQQEVIKYQSFVSLLQLVTEEALMAFSSHDKSPEKQAAQLYIIENAIVYLKDINNKGKDTILEKIASANLKISNSLSSWLVLEMGRGRVRSPSTLAHEALEEKQNMRAEKTKRRVLAPPKPSSLTNERLPSAEGTKSRATEVLKIEL